MAVPMTDTEFLNLAAEGARQRWRADMGLRGAFSTADEFATFVMAAASGNLAVAVPGWEKEWNASAALQKEFPTASSYTAFKKWEHGQRRGH